MKSLEHFYGGDQTSHTPQSYSTFLFLYPLSLSTKIIKKKKCEYFKILFSEAHCNHFIKSTNIWRNKSRYTKENVCATFVDLKENKEDWAFFLMSWTSPSNIKNTQDYKVSSQYEIKSSPAAATVHYKIV